MSELGRDDAAAGLCHLDGGEDVYRDQIWSSTTVDRTPQEIHTIGLDQIERLEDEYRRMAGPRLDTTDIDEIYTRLRDDESMRYQSGDDIVRDATAALERAQLVATSWFGAIPESECIATETPAGPLAFYSPPDLDTGKPGRFFFNTGDPTAWATYQLEAITFGEIDRYIGMPAQALSYMIGRLEIDDIRAQAEAEPDFEITRFHDQVLEHGMVPLATLSRTILG